MNLASIRLVTNDLEVPAGVLHDADGRRRHAAQSGIRRAWPRRRAPAVSSERLVQQFNAGAAIAAANRSAIIEFEVDDVDAVRARLGDTVDYAMPPTDMPWGNRSMLLRDPDGNVVNVFARSRRSG